MKSLNRAIARTVSQLARYGREGCHLPMLMALENHLDALLTMERKQLEQSGAICGLKNFNRAQDPGRDPAFIRALGITPESIMAQMQKHANDNAQGATSAPEQWPPSIPPWLWRIGDALLCNTGMFAGFTKGNYYRIINIAGGDNCYVQDDEGKEYTISGETVRFFTNYTRREVPA
jgi:hypothetical protein